MKQFLTLALFAAVAASCNNDEEQNNTAEKTSLQSGRKELTGGGSWKGSFSNGMKGDAIRFDVNDNELQNLTFEGYWRCDGKLDLTTLGPEESFTIKNGAVDGVITEPESGFRFELHGTIGGDKADGTLRISNVGAGCDTYKLVWTATKE